MAMRYVDGTSISRDDEALVVAQMRDIYGGSDLTSGMERLISDLVISDDLTREFQKRWLASSDEVPKFGITVFASNVWPLTISKDEFIIPQDLLPTYEAFTSFYQNKYT